MSVSVLSPPCMCPGILSSVKVAERPPFWKELLTWLALSFLCILLSICNLNQNRMILTFGIEHRKHKLYKVCTIDDTVLTSTYFTKK